MAARHMASALTVALLLAAAAPAAAEILSYNFDSGIGSDFTTINDQNKFTIDNAGGAVHIDKVLPDTPPVPNEFIGGGIRTNFALGGDFTATVDVMLHEFPPGGGVHMLNEAVLGALSLTDPSNNVSVLRFRAGDLDKLEMFATPPGPVGLTDSTDTTGRFRLERVGTVLRGYFDPEMDGSFNLVGQVDNNVSDNYFIALLAVQGANQGTRSSTDLEISFDNLVIEADFIVRATPEPASLALLGLGLAGLGLAQRRRRAVR